MKNLKNREDEPWQESATIMYAFFPDLGDEIFISDERKRTIARLVNWILQSCQINTDDFLLLIKDDKLPDKEK